MNLRAPKRIVLPPVRPNAGVEAEYRRHLMRLVEQMDSHLTRAITAAYKAKPPHAMAADASPARALRDLLEQEAARWNRTFAEASHKMAKDFATGALKASDYQFSSHLRKAGFSVKWQMSRPMNDAYQALVGENVGLIKSISSQHLADVQGLVMRSVQAGRSLSELTDQLQQRYDVTRRRAALIARDQNNKATAILNRVRQKSLGIKQAQWSHTSASVHPRIEHEEFDGRVYDIEEGHDFGDGFGPVLPGEAINCGCTGRSIIPGFNEDDPDVEGPGGEEEDDRGAA